MAVRFGPKGDYTPIPLPPSSLEPVTPPDPREPPHPGPQRAEAPQEKNATRPNP